MQLDLRRSAAIVLAGTAILLAAAPVHAADTLNIVSWGGAYTHSQVEAYMKPYTEKTGTEFNVIDYNGGLDQVARQVESGNIEWDIVDVELSDAIKGCDGGLLEPIPEGLLPTAPDGTPVDDDFLPNTLQECAVGEVVWATVFAYDQTKVGDDPPKTLLDFFDFEKYPGKRGLRKSPRVNIEWALMADGVPHDQVYQELVKPGGVARAFRVLSQIRDNVVWWEAGSEPVQLLGDGAVVMTSAYNGRLFDPIVNEGKPWTIVWDRQVWDVDLWAIVKGTPNLERALDFLAFSTDTQRLADQANYISYGPVRRSSMDLISSEMKWQLPTSDENLATAIQNDFEWWAENQDRLDRRFAEWFAGG